MIVSSLCPPEISALYSDHLRGFASHLYYFDSIESTNTFLAQLKENTVVAMDDLQSCNTFQSCMVCIAGEQTKGRGRGMHIWHASDQDIFFSLRFTLLPSQLEGFSLCIALLCVRTLEQLGFEGLAIKWPNDIFFSGKKCGGILIESLYQHDQVTVIVGVGLNIATQLPGAVKDAASSLYDSMAVNGYDKEQLRVLLIKGLVNGLFNDTIWQAHSLTQKHCRDFLLTYWSAYDFCRGKKVKVINSSNEWIGVMRGIDMDGSVVLEVGNDWVRVCAGSLMLLD